ncbi:MAG: DNA integrity scanning diadenylate cyclase DisA, partial [Actinomycetota bacterium]
LQQPAWRQQQVALERSNQAIQTLERYRARLDVVSRKLSALEVEDLVTVRHVVEVLQRAEMVVRISTEIEHNLIELGSDGRLVRLQLEELMVGVEDDRRLLITDYLSPGSDLDVNSAMRALAALDDDALFDDARLAKTLHLVSDDGELDTQREAKGVRLLSKLPGMNEATVMRVVDHFGSLVKILGATAAELEVVDGIGHGLAKALKDGTVRLAGDSIIDQY